jgi:hypothetical protein
LLPVVVVVVVTLLVVVVVVKPLRFSRTIFRRTRPTNFRSALAGREVFAIGLMQPITVKMA